jgi:hypothetical protein
LKSFFLLAQLELFF